MMVTTGRNETEKPIYPVHKDYAPLLFRAIELGDKVAYDYLNWLCEELVVYVALGVKALSIADRELSVVLSGGVPKGGDIMYKRLLHYLEQSLPSACLIDARLEPVVGAMLLGYDRVYPHGVPEDVMDALEKNCAPRSLFREAAEKLVYLSS